MGDKKSGDESKEMLLRPRDAAVQLQISYPTIKQWIYHQKLRAVKTPGGHYRIPESEIERLQPDIPARDPLFKNRDRFRRISGRNQLVGRVIDLRIDGLMAQVTLSISGQRLISIITADAVREMRLAKGQIAAALIKSTEVMVMRPQ